jgi:multidrug efflux pump subunit AcrB
MALGALLLGGGFSLSVLSLDRLPEFSYPRVTVETLYPGMAAAELRSIVTIPVEDALSSVKGLQRIRSVSRDGASVVVLDFRWGTDPNGASVLVREAIDGVYPNLPEGVKKPLVVPGDPDEEPHSILSVHSRTGDGVFERNMAEYEIRSLLRTLDGVGRVVLVGGERPEALIRVDIPRALSGGMGPGELAQYLSSETVDVPGGNAREGDMELVVVSTGRPGSMEELSRVLVPLGSSPARISDLAELSEGRARRRSLFLSRNREETALEIYRRSGADPAALSRDLRRVLEGAAFSRDLEVELVYDSSPAILEGVKNLGVSALLGALAVTGTLLFFIRRLRYSLLAALSIPVSASAALIALALAGRSLNGMSLGGIALGIGLVSDTSVIVLDLLHRRFSASPRRPPPEELGELAASVSASSFASTATTAVVFFPIMFLPGPLGALFGDCSLALIASITAGWLFAQLALPSLYRLLHGPARCRRAAPAAPGGAGALRRYRLLLAAGIRRPLPVFLSAGVLSLAGALILFTRPAAFVFPDAAVEAELILGFPAGTDLEAAGCCGLLLSRALSEIPGIRRIFGRAGAEEEDVGRRADTDYRKEDLRLRCIFAPGADPAEVLGEIRGILAGTGGSLPPGTTWSAGYPQDRTERLLGLSPARTLAIRGKDPEEAGVRAREAAAKLRGAAYTLRPGGRRPELRIRPDREAAAQLGISALRMAELVRAATEGLVAARLEIQGRPLEVRVTGDLRDRKPWGSPEPEALVAAIPLGLTDGGPIFLGAVGRVERTEAEAALARLDRGDVVYLDLNGGGALTETLEGMPGISRADESVFARYRSSLQLTVLLVLILLYMTLGAQFESFTLPGLLMLTIPFSLAGAGPALFLTGTGLDSGSVLGLVVLFGLAVNNGIVLYETAAEKMRGGLSPAAAVYAGAAGRFRPVLATTVTTLLALLPLAAVPLGAGQQSMAAAMLGGMAASTLLTLFALPPVFIPFLTPGGGPLTRR